MVAVLPTEAFVLKNATPGAGEGIMWNEHFPRTALFWSITQRVVVIPFRRFGTIYRPIKDSRPFKMEPKVVPKRRQWIATITCVITQNSAVLIYFAAETFSDSVRWLTWRQCVRLQECKTSERCGTPETSHGQNKNTSHILSLDYKISDTEAGEAGPSETPCLLAHVPDL